MNVPEWVKEVKIDALTYENHKWTLLYTLPDTAPAAVVLQPSKTELARKKEARRKNAAWPAMGSIVVNTTIGDSYQPPAHILGLEGKSFAEEAQLPGRPTANSSRRGYEDKLFDREDVLSQRRQLAKKRRPSEDTTEEVINPSPATISTEDTEEVMRPFIWPTGTDPCSGLPDDVKWDATWTSLHDK